jgi:D-aspartate ligase
MFGDTSTPVVVLVCHRQVGIGIVRSLGRLGVPVYGIDADRFSPALSSKYCRGKFVWDLHAAPAEESLRFLAEVARQIGRRAILVPTSDIGAMFVAEHADRLGEQFIFPDRGADLIRSLCSKQEMYYLVQKFGLAAPRTVFPRSREDVIRYLDEARFPILLKPIYSRAAVRGGKLWRIALTHSARELLEHYDQVEDPSAPNAMIQEYIPGGDEMTWTFNGYFDRQGGCPVAFTGRKLRNFPAYFGQASLGICVGNRYVEEATVRFMKAIGYRGPLDLGYRFDTRDGLYKVNDINPRIGAMFRLFAGRNGMDVIRALYQDMTGQPVTASSTPEGRKWIVEDGDLFSSLRYWWDGKLTLGNWMRSLRGIEEAAFISRDDLMPFAAVCIMDAKQAVAHAVGSDARKTRARPHEYSGNMDSARDHA